MHQIAEKLIALRDADEALRNQLLTCGKLQDGYNEEMEALHNQNAEVLAHIIDEIGYPTIDKVGKEASEAAWLIVQHAIAQPQFMKRCAALLQQEVAQGKADAKSLAYLTDRIAVFEDRPQLYGTQFDWDDNGELSPNTFDDLHQVNQRRMSLGLNTLQEQTTIIRKHARSENRLPPKDLGRRRVELAAWKKQVGWVKD